MRTSRQREPLRWAWRGMSDCVASPADPALEAACRAAEAAEAAAAAAQKLADKGATLADWAALIQAVSIMLIPLAAVILIILLFNPIRQIVANRKFTIKIAGFELSAQEASDQLRKQVDDLQKKIAMLEGKGAPNQQIPAMFDATIAESPSPLSPAPAPLGPMAGPMRILWVDDRPRNNAYEVAGLEDEGHRVLQVTSTDQALDQLSGSRFDVVLSDMGRPEGRDAGLDLLKRLREAGSEISFGFYTSQSSIKRTGEDMRKLGIFVATSSYVELLKALKTLEAKV